MRTPQTGTSAGFRVVEDGTPFHGMTTVTEACSCMDMTGPSLGGTFVIESGEGGVAASGSVTLLAGGWNAGGACAQQGSGTWRSVAYGQSSTTSPYVQVNRGETSALGLGNGSPGSPARD